jgi:Cu+-exporting ATPase
MALEPMDAAEEDTGGNEELRDMTRRFWVSAVLTLPVFALAMGDMAVGWTASGAISHGALAWIQLVLSTPVGLWGGWPFFVRGYQSFRTMNLNMFSLIAIGTGAAYLYSLIATVAPGIFPASARGEHGAISVYFEAAAIIVTLVLLGQVLELRARRRTRGAIRALLDLSPKTARRITDGGEEDIPLSHVHEGDKLRVRPGEAVPVDGEIFEGSSGIDESLVTGESVPVEKGPGDAVTGGTINGNGSLVIEAKRVGQDTVLAQIVRMVSEAQRSRAPIQGMADKVAGYFVPAVVAVAVLTFAGWMLWGPEPRIAFAVINAVAVLIIACPCALGLATPMSIMVGVGRGATAGVLIRDAETLEVMEKVDTLVVDKTGTLTEGKPRLTGVVAAEGESEDDVLSYAAAVEAASEHPLATPIVEGAKERGVKRRSAGSVNAATGKGIEGTVDGARVRVGVGDYAAESGTMPKALEDEAAAQRERGRTVMFAARDGKVIGLLAVEDTIKKSTPAALEALRENGIHVIMATGDNARTAAAVASELGLEDVRAEMTPETKIELVKGLRKDGKTVAMAGDGINDAPALAAAHVGIAMGTGADVAMESAGITLLKGDLHGIVRARQLSHRTMRNIRQNLFFAFIYNALGVTIATGMFYPVTGWLLSPMIAAAAMSFSSVSVIANALRLRVVNLD